MLATLSFGSLTLTGCIPLPGNLFKSAANAIPTDMRPSSSVLRTETTGPALCDAGLVCPEISVDWKNGGSQYNLYADIFHKNQYDIQKFNFVVDGQNYSFSPSTASNYRKLQSSDLIDSSNSITVPRSFLTVLSKAKTITLTLNTSQGDVNGTLLDSNRESGGYKVFMRGYKQ